MDIARTNTDYRAWNSLHWIDEHGLHRFRPAKQNIGMEFYVFPLYRVQTLSSLDVSPLICQGYEVMPLS